MKISVVVSVLNEEKSINELMNSLISQSVKADEIVIVDGGSTDKTLELLRNWESNRRIELIELPGANRSEARNKGIERARNEYIAVTDAGCVVDKNWLKEIKESFKNGASSVAGFYEMQTTDDVGKMMAKFLGVLPNELNRDTFLPSSRSIGFTKKAWEDVGKYPEDLDTCEDLVFANKLKEKTKLEVNEKALVSWKVSSSYSWFFRKISGYAQGDVKARYKPHLWRIGTVFLRYMVFIPYPWLFLLYLIYIWWKLSEFQKMFIDKLLIQITADIAVMMGCLRGVLGS